MPKIIFTGGGSAGHITLNLALIPWFLEKKWEVVYIGSKGGMEEELIKQFPDVRYKSILTGKLRRYISFKNFVDVGKVILGCLQACFIVRQENPDIIFSKGGYVSFPVVVGGFVNRKKVFMHESDLTPGLANKLSLPMVDTFFTTFPETINNVKEKYQQKVSYIGPIQSDRLFNGNAQKGAEFAHLQPAKKTILVIGGSLGAKSINKAITENLDELLQNYQVIHITGKSGFNPELKKEGYAQFEYVNKELKDLFALADVVISRAGSNSIFELASLHKPMILVPLPNTSSRGEQYLNARSFVDRKFAELILDADITQKDILLPMIDKVYQNKAEYSANMQKEPLKTTNVAALCQMIVD